MTMAGLERPDRGSVTIDGERIDTMGEDRLARFRGRRIGFVFQSFHLIATMTALENVAAPLELPARPATLLPARRQRRTRRREGLSERTSHYPAQLSGGERQRVALARALSPRP